MSWSNKAEVDVLIEVAGFAKGSICKAAADCEAARHYRTVPMWAHAPAPAQGALYLVS